MTTPLIKVQCSTCGAAYMILQPIGSFPAPCGLCRPVGKGLVVPVRK
jgi:hypothetical protein